MAEKNVLLSIENLSVKFRVRGRVLTAIRNVSLDIYENESIAIVGESGSGKSVFTKTFAGMLDSNGFVDEGNIIFNDETLSDTTVKLSSGARSTIESAAAKLNEAARLELGAGTYQKILELESKLREKSSLSDEEAAKAEQERLDIIARRTDLYNLKQTLDPRKEKDKIKEATAQIAALDKELKALEQRNKQAAQAKKAAVQADAAFQKEYHQEHGRLQAQYEKEIAGQISQETRKRNEILAKEIYLSVGRYGLHQRMRYVRKLLAALKEAMKLGVDLNDEGQRNAVFDGVTFRVRYQIGRAHV